MSDVKLIPTSGDCFPAAATQDNEQQEGRSVPGIYVAAMKRQERKAECDGVDVEEREFSSRVSLGGRKPTVAAPAATITV